MSHQTGIRANDALLKFFGKCRDGKVRVVKVSIENEKLVLSKHKDAIGTWEDDYDKLIKPLIEENTPCYILYRLDSKNSSGYEWLFISWSPDTAAVRYKMLYASTKATLKQEFGSGQITDEIHATLPDDVTMNGFVRHTRARIAPAPLTMAETELAELKMGEVSVGLDVRHQTMSGVSFPLTERAEAALHGFVTREHNYVQLRIDMEEEQIHLALSGNVDVDKLRDKVPQDSARYHLYNFKHTHEGDYQEALVFIYSMPGYNCSVRERMMYSSCKGPLLDTIESQIGLVIAKKIESDEPDELTKDFLYDQVHPQKLLYRPKFDKPKGPPNRGAKRLTRPTAQE